MPGQWLFTVSGGSIAPVTAYQVVLVAVSPACSLLVLRRAMVRD